MFQPCDVRDEECSKQADNLSFCSSCLRHLCPDCTLHLVKINDAYGNEYWVPQSMDPNNPRIVKACPACAHLELTNAMNHFDPQTMHQHLEEHAGFNPVDYKQYDSFSDYHDALHYHDVNKTGAGLSYPEDHEYDNHIDPAIEATASIKEAINKKVLMRGGAASLLAGTIASGAAAHMVGVTPLIAPAAQVLSIHPVALGLVAGAGLYRHMRNKSAGNEQEKPGKHVNPNRLMGDNPVKADLTGDIDKLQDFKMPGQNIPMSHATVGGLLNPRNWFVGSSKHNWGNTEVEHPFLKNEDGTPATYKIPKTNSGYYAGYKSLLAPSRYETHELVSGLEKSILENKSDKFMSHLNPMEHSILRHASTAVLKDPTLPIEDRYKDDNILTHISQDMAWGVHGQQDKTGQPVVDEEHRKRVGFGIEEFKEETDPNTGLTRRVQTKPGHQAMIEAISSGSNDYLANMFDKRVGQAEKAHQRKRWGDKRLNDFDIVPNGLWLDSQTGKPCHHNAGNAVPVLTRGQAVVSLGVLNQLGVSTGLSRLDMAKKNNIPDEQSIPTPSPESTPEPVKPEPEPSAPTQTQPLTPTGTPPKPKSKKQKGGLGRGLDDILKDSSKKDSEIVNFLQEGPPMPPKPSKPQFYDLEQAEKIDQDVPGGPLDPNKGVQTPGQHRDKWENFQRGLTETLMGDRVFGKGELTPDQKAEVDEEFGKKIDIKIPRKNVRGGSITDQVTQDKYRPDVKEKIMSQKEAQGNPAQPEGWAVQYVVDPAAHPGSADLIAIEQQKRQDTVTQAVQDNPAPEDLENPAQPAGFAVPPPTNAPIPGQQATASVSKIARVYTSETAESVEGARVIIATNNNRVAGKVIAEAADNFWVKWDDGQSSIEDKEDYELVITSEE